MKKFSILISAIFLLAACSTSYDSASTYDDVYYTPKSENSQQVATTQSSGTTSLNYGSNTSTKPIEKSTETTSNIDDYSAYETYYLTESGDTLPSAETEYSYVEDGYDEYYDYEYASLINRFDNPTGNFGYYSPIYSPGVSVNMGYGWGYPSSYFSLGFGYGWGYPSYYNPWYYPYYGYGYGYGCGYYGNSYWAGYNNGYYNGYYAGGGGYYPGGGGEGSGYYPGDYYGPRTPRSGSLVGDGGSRESRADGGDDPQNQGYSMGRENRGAGTVAGATGTKTSGSPDEGRIAREFKPNEGPASISNKTVDVSQSEKLTKPTTESGLSAKSNNQGKAARSADVVESQKLTKPVQTQAGTEVGSRTRTTQQKTSVNKTYTKPTNTRDIGVVSRSKKYAKPTSNDLQTSSQPKNYSSPNYNRPRSSNEYTVPKTRTITGSSTQSSRSVSSQGKSNSSRSYYTPSRSSNSFSQPKQSKTYTSPARSSGTYSSPTRSTSTPARSSGSYSPRSSGSSSGSSGGNRSSGSSGGSKSSGGSSGSGSRGGR